MAVTGCLFVMNGTLLLGNLQAFVRYIWQINDPLSQISQLSSQVQSAFAAMGRIFNLMDEEEEVQNGKSRSDRTKSGVKSLLIMLFLGMMMKH